MSSTTDIYTVYKILNLVNSKVYIGITTRDPEVRWKEHIKRYKIRTCALYTAMNKHGIENFVFSVIEQTFTLNELLELETRKEISESLKKRARSQKSAFVAT